MGTNKKDDSQTPHFLALENMYLAAPINRMFGPTIEVEKGRSEITIKASEQYFHPAGAVHGSVYFKMLDDAAFFAASSLEQEVFLLTISFTTYLIRPVSCGVISSTGWVAAQTKNQFIAEAVVNNGSGKEIGRGNGVFVRSRVPLRDALGYSGGVRDLSC
jgi:uncharacterized protein (TIGR00369 family)